jgi:hypothetical protein
VVAVVELLLFIRSFRPTFLLREAVPPAYEQFARSHRGDDRILNLGYPDRSMSLGLYEIWGYDPVIPKRYAELIFYTQGRDPDKAGQQITFQKIPMTFRMLRFAYSLEPEDDTLHFKQFANPMPRFQLVSRYRVVPGRDRLLAEMSAKSFDPAAEVLLESEPSTKPDPTGRGGTVSLVGSSTDHLELEARLETASILLITDGYSKGWRARALSGSSQDSYQVMPADYVLRAVPLKAGTHHIVVEYCPAAFRIGRVISAGSWLVFAGLAVFLACRARASKTLRIISAVSP